MPITANVIAAASPHEVLKLSMTIATTMSRLPPYRLSVATRLDDFKSIRKSVLQSERQRERCAIGVQQGHYRGCSPEGGIDRRVRPGVLASLLASRARQGPSLKAWPAAADPVLWGSLLTGVFEEAGVEAVAGAIAVRPRRVKVNLAWFHHAADYSGPCHE
jgi:hypothetical protein